MDALALARALLDDELLRRRGVFDEPWQPTDFSLGPVEWRTFTESLHPRNPKGSVGGGRFRSLLQRVVDAVQAGDTGLKDFNRRQLMEAARQSGISVRPGMSDAALRQALHEHHGRGKAPVKAAKKAAKKAAAPAKKAAPAVGSGFGRRFAAAAAGDEALQAAPVLVHFDEATDRWVASDAVPPARRARVAKAVHDYWDIGQDVNEYQRVGEAAYLARRGRKASVAAVRRISAGLDEALDGSVLDRDVAVWRGFGGRTLFGPDPEHWADDLTDVSWSDAGYVSTSTERSDAELYLTQGSAGAAAQQGVLARLVLPSGGHVLNLGEFEGGELLLSRGWRFRVAADHGWQTVGRRRQRLLDVEAIPPTPAKAAAKKAVKAAKKAVPAGELTGKGHVRPRPLSDKALVAGLDRILAEGENVPGFNEPNPGMTGSSSPADILRHMRDRIAAGEVPTFRGHTPTERVHNLFEDLGRGYGQIGRTGRRSPMTDLIDAMPDLLYGRGEAPAKAATEPLVGAAAHEAAFPARPLSPEVLDAVDTYGKGGASAVNMMLNQGAGEITERQGRYAAGIARRLDEAMAGQSVSHDIVVERGLPDLRQLFGRTGPRVGATFVEHGFVSTSATGAAFAYETQGSVRLRIRVPAGTRALSLPDPPAGAPRGALERGEVVLDRGLTYRVAKVDGPDASGVWRLDVEVVPTPAKAVAKKAVKAAPAKAAAPVSAAGAIPRFRISGTDPQSVAALRTSLRDVSGMHATFAEADDRITRALDNPDYDAESKRLARLVAQVGVPTARRIAWEADAEAGLARQVQQQRPSDPTLGPYDDLPPVTDRELFKAKADAALEMHDQLAGKPIVVRLRPDALSSVLRDGRMKNAYETGRSGGDSGTSAGYRAKRARAEQIFFGIDPKAPASERPIYAHVAVAGVRAVPSDSGLDRLSAYGDVQIVLRDTVRPRTTASMGDSIDDHILPSPIDAPEWYSTAAGRFGRYAEAQVHGGVSTSDIAEVVFPSAPDAAMRAELKRAGIAWRVLSPDTSRSVFDEPWRPTDFTLDEESRALLWGSGALT